MKAFEPHDYQKFALRWLVQRTLLDGKQGGAYFLDPGLGKTSTTLCWIRLLKMLGLSRKFLIVAPLRVCYSVWPNECRKWSQFAGLTTSIVHGTPTKRMAALSKPADIYLINPEGVEWLRDYYANRPVPFQTLVIDESSNFRNWGSGRTKALRKLVRQFSYRLILTGTPSPKGLEDLFAQVYMVDLGESLGTSVTKFRTRFFYRGGYGGYSWEPMQGSKEAVEKLIADCCLRLAAEDHLDLPDLLINDVWVDLPAKLLKDYKRLEREMFLALDEEKELSPVNAGAKYLSCRQFANGGVYDADKVAHHLHTEKIDAATSIINELQGKPALLAFQFKHDLVRIQKAFPKVKFIDGSVSGKDTDRLVEEWNKGKIPLLAVQPQALSHGINMQSGPGRDIIWLGLTDNLETYLQFNARIFRQGVDGNVRIHRILADRTVDIAVRDRIESKDSSQKSLLDALNQYREHANG